MSATLESTLPSEPCSTSTVVLTTSCFLPGMYHCKCIATLIPLCGLEAKSVCNRRKHLLFIHVFCSTVLDCTGLLFRSIFHRLVDIYYIEGQQVYQSGRTKVYAL